MFYIGTPREDRRILRLTWFLTDGARPDLRSRWLTEDLHLTGEEAGVGYGEFRNHSVTGKCETETIAQPASEGWEMSIQ